jgi:polar amino acid transport system substrate-binding protein
MFWYNWGWRRAGFGLCAALALAGAGHAAHATDVAEIKSHGKAVIGTEAAYSPFEFVQDGKIVGYDEDILNHIIADWGVKLEQIDVPFAGILAGLDQKKFDFVATALIMNPDRVVKYAFTLPVARGDVVFAQLKGSKKMQHGVGDLSGLVVGSGVPPGGPAVVLTHYNDELKKSGKGAASILRFPSAPETFLALANGQVDCVIQADLVVQEAMKKQPDTYEIVGRIGDPFYIGWVARAEDTKLRDEISGEIRKFRDSGELATLQQKWFGHKMEIPDSGYLPAGSK